MAYYKSISEYFDDSIKEYLSNNFLEDNYPIYVNNDTNMNNKAILNIHEIITRDNFYKKNSEINIKDIFQQV